MNEVGQIRFLKDSLRLAKDQADHANTLLLGIIGDKCRSCKKQRDCWRLYHYMWLAEVALKGGDEWECANYDPLSCASVGALVQATREGRIIHDDDFVKAARNAGRRAKRLNDAVEKAHKQAGKSKLHFP